jgi:hypothetical protein
MEALIGTMKTTSASSETVRFMPISSFATSEGGNCVKDAPARRAKTVDDFDTGAILKDKKLIVTDRCSRAEHDCQRRKKRANQPAPETKRPPWRSMIDA